MSTYLTPRLNSTTTGWKPSSLGSTRCGILDLGSSGASPPGFSTGGGYTGYSTIQMDPYIYISKPIYGLTAGLPYMNWTAACTGSSSGFGCRLQKTTNWNVALWRPSTDSQVAGWSGGCGDSSSWKLSGPFDMSGSFSMAACPGARNGDVMVHYVYGDTIWIANTNPGGWANVWGIYAVCDYTFNFTASDFTPAAPPTSKGSPFSAGFNTGFDGVFGAD